MPPGRARGCKKMCPRIGSPGARSQEPSPATNWGPAGGAGRVNETGVRHLENAGDRGLKGPPAAPRTMCCGSSIAGSSRFLAGNSKCGFSSRALSDFLPVHLAIFRGSDSLISPSRPYAHTYESRAGADVYMYVYVQACTHVCHTWVYVCM